MMDFLMLILGIESAISMTKSVGFLMLGGASKKFGRKRTADYLRFKSSVLTKIVRTEKSNKILGDGVKLLAKDLAVDAAIAAVLTLL